MSSSMAKMKLDLLPKELKNEPRSAETLRKLRIDEFIIVYVSRRAKRG